MPVLEFAFDVVGGECDRGLPQADRMQIAVCDGQPQLLTDLAHAVWDGLAGLVVTTKR